MVNNLEMKVDNNKAKTGQGIRIGKDRFKDKTGTRT